MFRPGYTVVTGIDLDHPETPARVTAILGSSYNICASRTNLYATYAVNTGEIAAPDMPATRTRIYKFSLDDSGLLYRASNSVPYTNYFWSGLNEYAGTLRIVTSDAVYDANKPMIPGLNGTSLFLLDPGLTLTGKSENVVEGDPSGTALFMGPRVCFRNVVGPGNVLTMWDASDEAAPVELGNVRIDGWYDDLYPYQGDLWLGFGNDTFKIYDSYGRAGIKASLLDLHDIAAPPEVSSVIIGEKESIVGSTYDNPAAVLISTSPNLIVFTAVERRIPQETVNGYPSTVSVAVFQGVYVYSVGTDGGLIFKGRITHIQNGSFDDTAANKALAIRGSVLIGTTLFTISDTTIVASAIDDLHLLGMLVE
jgi:uncharacterized secreted protein with C-terminal beta-propeller domain